jgi:hypothetical protein
MRIKVGIVYHHPNIKDVIYIPYRTSTETVRVRALYMQTPRGKPAIKQPEILLMREATGASHSYISTNEDNSKRMPYKYKAETLMKYGWNIDVFEEYFSTEIEPMLRPITKDKQKFKQSIINYGKR